MLQRGLGFHPEFLQDIAHMEFDGRRVTDWVNNKIAALLLKRCNFRYWLAYRCLFGRILREFVVDSAHDL